MINELEYYKTHGIISDPHEFSEVIERQPSEIESIFLNALSFVWNDYLLTENIFKIPESYTEDTGIRNMKKRLKTIAGRMNNHRELRYESLSVGNSRDISVFICAILRHKGIPARVRSGFATFFDPVKKYDYWICEYWNERASKWLWVDGWMYQIQQETYRIPSGYLRNLSTLNFDPLNLDKKFFYSGAKAWQKCRNKKEEFQNYTSSIVDYEGEWFVRDNMIRDLYCLNKIEPLAMDVWGKMGKDHKTITKEEYQLYDTVAEAILSPDTTLERLHELVEVFHADGVPEKWI